jgi:hypothetical protein
MKKIEMKKVKLQLNRETLQALDPSQLPAVNGAATFVSCPDTSCPRVTTCFC